MEGLALDKYQIIQFFETLYPKTQWPGCLNIEFIRKNEDKSSSLLSRVHLTSLDDVHQIDYEEWARYQSGGGNVYFSNAFLNVAGKGRKTTTRQAVVGINHLWADVDNVKQNQLDLITRYFPEPPTLVTWTGNGFHFYWKLDQPCFQIEPKGLAEKLVRKSHNWVIGADSTMNLNRILRVAGTFNVKPERIIAGDIPMCQIIESNPAAIYTAEQLEGILLSFPEIKLPDTYKQDHIVEGKYIGDKEDRSTRDYNIALQLFSAGHNIEEVRYVLSNPKWGCSDKVLEKAQKGDESYLKLTVEKAYLESGALQRGGAIYDDGSKIVKKKVHANGFVEEVPISNFCIVPLRRVYIKDIHQADEELMEIQVRCGRDRVKEMILGADSFISAKQLLLAVGIPFLTFSGTDTDFSHYITYLSSKEIPITTATKTIGWSDGNSSFVVPDGVLCGPPVEYIDNGMMPHIKVCEESIELTSEFVQELFRKTRLLHKPSVSILTLGWMLSSVFSPQIRDKYRDQFPTLCLHGSPGTGKTTMARTFMRSLFGVLHDFSGRSSSAVLKRALSYVNALPILIDEYESMSLDMNSLLRSLWQRGAAQMMDRSTNFTSATNLVLQAPTVVTNLAGIDDEAAQDRSVNLRLTPYNRESGIQAINWFDSLPVGGFLRTWLAEDSSWINYITDIRNSVDTSDRQRHAFACVAAPLLHLARKFQVANVDLNALSAYWGGHHEVIVKPIEVIDQLISHLMRTLLLLPRNPGYRTEGNVIYIHRAHMLNLCVTEAVKLRLEYPIERRWLQKCLMDAEACSEGVIKYTHPANLYGKTAVCTQFDLTKMPLVHEAYMGYLDLPEDIKVKATVERSGIDDKE